MSVLVQLKVFDSFQEHFEMQHCLFNMRLFRYAVFDSIRKGIIDIVEFKRFIESSAVVVVNA